MTYSGSASSLTCGPFFDPTKPPCDCSCPCPCDDKQSSTHPVRYQNGKIELSVSDLGSGGFGLPWGHTRQYTNRLLQDAGTPASFNTGHGYNWLVTQWPALSRKSDGTVIASAGADRLHFFLETSPDNYVPMYGAHQQIEHDVDAALYTRTGRDGFVWEFNDFDAPEAPGMLCRVIAPGGGQLQVVAYHGRQIAAVERSAEDENGQTCSERYEYVYLEENGQPAQLASVTLRRRASDSAPWTDVRRAVYTYYNDGDAHGSAGDLKTASVQAMVGGVWTDVKVHYYRYWKDEAGGKGFQHGLKYVLGPEAFARLGDDPQVADRFTASDAIVAQYADLYFEYDAQQRVTKETVAAGSQSYSFTYEDRTDPYFYGYNNWVRKTTETQPDGSQVIVFTNHIGQVLLRELRDGANSWVEHWQYDELDGHQVLHAHPSAVAGYALASESNDLVVTLKDNDGLIELREYYTADDLPAGAIEGELAYEKIKRGAQGTEIKLRHRQYTQHSAGGQTVNPIAKETVYRNEDGSGAIETSYSYTFHLGTVQIQERVRGWLKGGAG